jgi:type IV pilus biogenesis protein CpaD/CtpE
LGEILEFPSQQVQGLSFLENELKVLLAAKGADQELMEFAATTVREIYERYANAENYSFNLQLPEGMDQADAETLKDDIQQGVESIRAGNHAVIVRLIAELTMAEVRLFQAGRG